MAIGVSFPAECSVDQGRASCEGGGPFSGRVPRAALPGLLVSSYPHLSVKIMGNKSQDAIFRRTKAARDRRRPVMLPNFPDGFFTASVESGLDQDGRDDAAR
jgi:hypothetical protein